MVRFDHVVSMKLLYCIIKTMPHEVVKGVLCLLVLSIS